MGEHVGGDRGRHVLREDLPEVRARDVTVDVASGHAGRVVLDHRQLQGRRKEPATGIGDRVQQPLDELARGRREGGDVDVGTDVGVLGVGDDEAAVGVTDEDDRSVDRRQLLLELLGVVSRGPERIVEGLDRQSPAAQFLRDVAPARRIGECPVYEDDGRGRRLGVGGGHRQADGRGHQRRDEHCPSGQFPERDSGVHTDGLSRGERGRAGT